MDHKLEKVFLEIRYEPDMNCANNIWCAVVSRHQRDLRFKFWSFSIIGLLALAGAVPAVLMLSNDLARSGFFEYLSLGLSRGLSIVNYADEFIMSLLESLPVLSIHISVLLVFIFFLSVKYASKQIIKMPLSLSF